MKNLRMTGKTTIVWFLAALMVVGLGGFGVTSFTGGSTAIGRVGDTKVTADDYMRSMRQQLQAFSQQAGRHFTMTEAQQMGLPQAVLAQLVTAAAIEEQARTIGISVGDQRVFDSIAQAPAFQSLSGQFDRNAYASILRQQGMTEATFEREVRVDEARLLIQRAVTGGVVAPAPMVARTTDWLLERRALSWRELTAADLAEPVADADEAALESWHTVNADRFTAPEKRKLTYVWVTPEALAPEVELDDAALRAVYDQNIADYQQPERRMVSRLVMPSEQAAIDGKAQIDAGEIPFESLVLQRGLQIDDAYIGEMTKEQLGAAGEAVFALDQPGVVGPIQTDLGPALYAMNAILDPVDIPFEQARESLRTEAAIDRAARIIDTRSGEFEDLLASGATLEEVADETPLELGTIEWSANETPAAGSIAGYEAFRERAATITAQDFPQLAQLDDGGVFALRLDEIVPPSLIPFEEVRDDVLADWRRDETHRRLLALAETQRLATPGDDAATPEWRNETPLTRDGWIENLPPDVLQRAFEMEPVAGEVEIADSGDRVFLVRLDAIQPADPAQDEAARISEAVGNRIGETLRNDLFEYYNRAIQTRAGVELNQNVINTVNTQVQ